MQIHQLKPIHKIKSRKRVGRGGKHGTFSGRGVKGQKARAGRKTEPIIRLIIKRYPKLRGYRFKSKFKSQKLKVTVINLDVLEEKFKTDDKINPTVLIEKKLIRRIKGKIPLVKILAKGEITKKLIIEKCQLSKNAKVKIEKAGGQVV